MIYTIEGRDNWNGAAFYFSNEHGHLFAESKDKVHTFASLEDARAVVRLLVKVSEMDPFLGYERVEIVERDPRSGAAKRTVEHADIHYYRAP